MTLRPLYLGKYTTGSASLLIAISLAVSPVIFPVFAAKLSPNVNVLVAPFTPAGVDSRLINKFELQSQSLGAVRFPFTPAGMDSGRNRTMTVAARTDSLLSVNAVSIKNMLSSMEPGGAKTVRVNPSDYRLSAARGWQGFVLPKTQKLQSAAPLSDLVGRGDFRLDDNTKRPASRFNTKMTLDQTRQAAPSPRGNAASGDYLVDVGGSFSISHKIDVTAGVRYNSERDRVVPQANNAQDSEAVYVGTKIRF